MYDKTDFYTSSQKVPTILKKTGLATARMPNYTPTGKLMIYGFAA